MGVWTKSNIQWLFNGVAHLVLTLYTPPQHTSTLQTGLGLGIVFSRPRARYKG